MQLHVLLTVLASTATALTGLTYEDKACTGNSGIQLSVNCESNCRSLESEFDGFPKSVKVNSAEPNQRIVVYQDAGCSGFSQNAANCCGATGVIPACLTNPNGKKWKSYKVERIQGIAGGGTACPCEQPGCPKGTS